MQALLILAHTAPDHVIRLSKLMKKRFEVYIHYDKKAPLTSEKIREMEECGIHCFQAVSVNWSGWSVGAASEFLMREALKNPKITHVHVISGQDQPAMNVDDIYEFYENNANLYIECYAAEGVKKSGEPIVWWQKYYYNYDKVNRRTTFGKIYHRLLIAAQTILGIDKFKKYHVDLELYHGSQWMDLPRDAVEYLLKYFDSHPNVQKLFKTGFCSDEFWIQTILNNSEFKNRIVSDYHRYIVWEHRYNSYPAILDERDFEEITCGKYHFCRKTVPVHSEKLIALLGQKNGNDES